MMRSRMKIEKPGEIEVTLTVTMSAGRWEKIRDWLRESKAAHCDPQQQFAGAIDNLLGQVRKVLWRDEPEKDEPSGLAIASRDILAWYDAPAKHPQAGDIFEKLRAALSSEARRQIPGMTE